jgi:hypothetical protein
MQKYSESDSKGVYKESLILDSGMRRLFGSWSWNIY